LTTTKRYIENYKNVSQDIRDQLNAEAEAVQIILTGIDNDIYSTVDACPNAREMWKANERSQQAATRNKGKSIVNSPPPIYDQEPTMVAEDDEMSKDKEIDKLMALISLPFKKIYKPTNNNLRTLSNTSRANQDNSPRINRGTGKGMSETETGKGCSLSQGKDAIVNWKHIVPNNDNYNVFAIESEHPEQSKSVNDTYLIEQDEHNVIIDSLDMSYDREQVNHDDDDDLANERDFLASLIEKLKCKIDDNKNRNKFLETSNKIKFYKTRKDKEIDKVIALDNNVKVLDNIVYKISQSVQTMNMINRNCKTSFAKPEFLKKAQRANPRLYDIGCYNYNLALMLAPESDEVIRLEKQSRSKLSDLIRPFDYEKLNNLYDLFVPQREKSYAQRYFSERTKMPMAVPISTREPKRIVNQSVVTPLRSTVASESTNQKPKHTTRRLYKNLLHGLRPLKNSLKDGRGLDVDTQTTWMQRDYRETRAESKNARCFVLTLPDGTYLEESKSFVLHFFGDNHCMGFVMNKDFVCDDFDWRKEDDNGGGKVNKKEEEDGWAMTHQYLHVASQVSLDPPKTKAKADVFLHQHIDEMLEFEYSNCDDPSTLRKDLEIRFNNQNEVLLPSARDEWNNLRFQDFKKNFWLCSVCTHCTTTHTKIGPQRRLGIYVGYETSSIIRYVEPLTGDVFTSRFVDCHFIEAIFLPLGGEKKTHEKDVSWSEPSLLYLDSRTKQTANAPARVELLNKQAGNNIAQESQKRLKRRRPIGSKDKNSRKRKGTEKNSDHDENVLDETQDIKTLPKE
nr:hypothetical protein [Tanacetum cinerariifolium]